MGVCSSFDSSSASSGRLTVISHRLDYSQSLGNFNALANGNSKTRDRESIQEIQTRGNDEKPEDDEPDAEVEAVADADTDADASGHATGASAGPLVFGSADFSSRKCKFNASNGDFNTLNQLNQSQAADTEQFEGDFQSAPQIDLSPPTADGFAEFNSHNSAADIDADTGTGIGVGTAVIRSLKGYFLSSDKPNQDRAFVRFSLFGSTRVHLYGICDGHGAEGHSVAQFVEDHLCALLDEQSASFHIAPAEAISRAIQNLEYHLSESAINTSFSGSTCVFAIRIDTRIFIANIGDSRCAIVRYDQNRRQMRCDALSVDHKPDLPREHARILASGGRVEPSPCDDDSADAGPNRVWTRELALPGLAMSRSIGDSIGHTCGIISEPEVMELAMSGEDEFLILGSDGLWEFMSNENVGKIVWESRGNLTQAADRLCDAAVKSWRSRGPVMDDMSFVIVQLKPILGLPPLTCPIAVAPNQSQIQNQIPPSSPKRGDFTK